MSSEATQTVGVYDVLAWLEANKKSLIIAFVAVVVVGFGIAVYQYQADQKELAASDALLKLRPTIGGQDTAEQVAPSAYLQVAQQYPGTKAADRALLFAAGALYEEGKYSEAQAQFAKFLQDRPQSPFASTAAYGVASCQEAQNNLDHALTGYQNLSVRYPNSSVLGDAKLATARIYEAKNQPELALRLYEELMRPTAVSMGNPEAMMRRQALLSQHPELAKTNALTAAVQPATTLTLTNPPSVTATSAPPTGQVPAPAPAATNPAASKP